MNIFRKIWPIKIIMMMNSRFWQMVQIWISLKTKWLHFHTMMRNIRFQLLWCTRNLQRSQTKTKKTKAPPTSTISNQLSLKTSIGSNNSWQVCSNWSHHWKLRSHMINSELSLNSTQLAKERRNLISKWSRKQSNISTKLDARYLYWFRVILNWIKQCTKKWCSTRRNIWCCFSQIKLMRSRNSARWSTWEIDIRMSNNENDKDGEGKRIMYGKYDI